MELKEYIQLIKKNRWLFFYLWLGVVAVVLVWLFSRPKSYDVSLAVEISRIASQNQTSDYRYDQYYRMEADDKFSDTVVQWLKDPQVVSSIFDRSRIFKESYSLRQLTNTFQAEKLSANYIQIRFSIENIEDGRKISQSLAELIKSKTQQLNQNNQDPNWFSLVVNDPLVIPHKRNATLIISAAAVGGFLLAVLGVLIKHYWED